MGQVPSDHLTAAAATPGELARVSSGLLLAMGVAHVHSRSHAASFCRLHRVTAATRMVNFAAAGSVGGMVPGDARCPSNFVGKGKTAGRVIG